MLAANRRHHWCEIWQQISESVLSPSLLSYLVLESIKLVKLQVVQITCCIHKGICKITWIKEVYSNFHSLKQKHILNWLDHCFVYETILKLTNGT